MAPVMLAALDPLGVIMTIVGLGGLIFFHELGHFLACRLTGTRVEAFSIGFGKEILGWTRNRTRYRIGIVPLGGYVKMAAENPGERRTGAPDEFPNKPFSARIFIMSAGVLFNLILAFALFAWAFRAGVPLRTREIGDVTQGGAAWKAGVRAGDVVTHIDGQEIVDFTDLLAATLLGDGSPITLTVERAGDRLEIPIDVGDADGPGLGVQSAIGREAVAVVADSPAAKADGRVGDVVLAINGEPVAGPTRLHETLTGIAIRAPTGTRVLDLALRVQRKDGAEETLAARLPLGDRPFIGITPYEGTRIDAVADGSVAARFLRKGDEIVRLNGQPLLDLQSLDNAAPAAVNECIVRRDGAEVALSVPPGTTLLDIAKGVVGRADPQTLKVTPYAHGPAARAGLKPGDLIVRVTGHPVTSFPDATKAILAHGVKPLEIEIDRSGEKTTLTIDPARWNPEVELGYEYAPVMVPHRETNVIRAAAIGWHETVRLIRMTLLTVKGLVTRRVSAENISGPIMLVRATYSMFDQGFGLFLHILGLISVNLAILNLLPIPILDGGQIVLLVAEKLRGKPLPDRVVGYLQVAGLVLILGLVVLVFKNDIANLLQ